MGAICEQALRRLKPGGRLVADFSSIENLISVRETLKQLADDVKLLMINIFHGTEQFEQVRFEAMNPRFLAAVIKPEKS